MGKKATTKKGWPTQKDHPRPIKGSRMGQR